MKTAIKYLVFYKNTNNLASYKLFRKGDFFKSFLYNPRKNYIRSQNKDIIGILEKYINKEINYNITKEMLEPLFDFIIPINSNKYCAG